MNIHLFFLFLSVLPGLLVTYISYSSFWRAQIYLFILNYILLLFFISLILSQLYNFLLPHLFGIMLCYHCFSSLVENYLNFYSYRCILSAKFLSKCCSHFFMSLIPFICLSKQFSRTPAPDINLPLFYQCFVRCHFIHFEHTLACWKQICLRLLYILDLLFMLSVYYMYLFSWS